MKKASAGEQIITRPDASVPLGGEYDVIVLGGGFAGVAAAVAASRMGSRVLLLEKHVILGGLATAGIITHYLALCDGHGRKIISGMAEELMYTAIRYSYDTLAEEWRGGPSFVESPSKRYDTWFSFPECAAALEELLANENVDFLYDVLFTEPVIKNGKVEAVITEEKGGRTAYRASAFIDATGDSVLYRKAGLPTVQGENLVSYGSHHMDIGRCRKALETGRIKDALEIHWYGDFPVPGRKRLFDLAKVSDSKEETEFILNGRSVYLKRLKEEGRGNDHGTVLWPSMMLARKVRRIVGEYTLTPDDVNKHFEDSVGAVSDWRNPGPIYEIPYRALYNKGLANVLTCGRSISSDGDSWEVTRVIPPAVLTGQAAGTAAAMAADQKCAAADISVAGLQHQLAAGNVLIHF